MTSEAADEAEDIEESQNIEEPRVELPCDLFSHGESSSVSEITFKTRKLVECEDSEEILSPQGKLASANAKGIAQWLHKVYRSSRGFELGTFDSAILSTTMRVQSRKWTPFALGYISDVVTMIHRFIGCVLDATCPEESVKSELLSVLWDSLVESYTKAIEHVQFLLTVELEGTPLTMNHYFNDTLQKW